MKTKSLLTILCGVSAAGNALGAALPLTSPSYSENFNSLASSGTANTALPAGWAFLEAPASVPLTYRAGTGSSTTGDTYSFGTDAADRAFGQLRSGSVVSILGVAIENQTGDTIQNLLISYTGEQWRLGESSRTGAAERMNFQYLIDASSLGTGTWTDFDSLDFVPPVASGTAGALDGNAAANRTSLSSTLTGLSLAPGQSIWFRWTDVDAGGSDDGLAIDDFTLEALAGTQPVPEPATWGLASGCFLGIVALLHSRRQRGRP